MSHLVQSTRAGADAGFALVGVIVLALVFKYPFFEFGPRYAAATGESLVEGYRRVGKWALWLYFIIGGVTGIIAMAAVTRFTAFLLGYAFGVRWSITALVAALTAACAGLLWVGRYRLLDLATKVILVVLALSTLVAASVTLPRADFSTLQFLPLQDAQLVVPLAFILALVGWMPSPVDIAVISSLWTLAKDKTIGIRTSVFVAQLDFAIGYVGTAILAFAFVILGATVMFGSGQSFSPQGPVFSTQLVDLYAQSLGAWTRPIVITAILTTMLSTSVAVIDGIPRAMARTLEVLRIRDLDRGVEVGSGRYYWSTVVLFIVMTVVINAAFSGTLTALVDFATIMAFIAGPILGYLNLRAVTSARVPVEHRPGPWMRGYTWVSIVLGIAFSAVYVVARF